MEPPPKKDRVAPNSLQNGATKRKKWVAPYRFLNGASGSKKLIKWSQQWLQIAQPSENTLKLSLIGREGAVRDAVEDLQ